MLCFRLGMGTGRRRGGGVSMSEIIIADAIALTIIVGYVVFLGLLL